MTLPSLAPTSRDTATRHELEAAIASAAADLRSAALALTGNPHDADDLIQDTLVRALRFSSGFRVGTNLTGWLRTILRNTARNGFRDAKRRPRPLQTDEAQQMMAEVPDRSLAAPVEPDEFETHADRFSGPVRDAVRALPETYRRVFLLASLGDYRYSEIAERLGIPIGTVMSRLHRARKALQTSLAAV